MTVKSVGVTIQNIRSVIHLYLIFTNLGLPLKNLLLFLCSRKFKGNSPFLRATLCQSWLFTYVISFDCHNHGKGVLSPFFKEGDSVITQLVGGPPPFIPLFIWL